MTSLPWTGSVQASTCGYPHPLTVWCVSRWQFLTWVTLGGAGCVTFGFYGLKPQRKTVTLAPLRFYASRTIIFCTMATFVRVGRWRGKDRRHTHLPYRRVCVCVCVGGCRGRGGGALFRSCTSSVCTDCGLIRQREGAGAAPCSFKSTSLLSSRRTPSSSRTATQQSVPLGHGEEIQRHTHN